MPPAVVGRVLARRWRRGGGKKNASGDDVATFAEATRGATVAERRAGRSPDPAAPPMATPSATAAPTGRLGDGRSAEAEGSTTPGAPPAIDRDDDASTTESEFSLSEVVEGYIRGGGQHPIFDARRSPSSEEDETLFSFPDAEFWVKESPPLTAAHPMVQTLLLPSSQESDKKLSSYAGAADCEDEDDDQLHLNDLLRVVTPPPSVGPQDRVSPTPSAMGMVQRTASKDYSDFEGYSMEGMSASVGFSSIASSMHHHRLASRSFDSIWEERDARSRTTADGSGEPPSAVLRDKLSLLEAALRDSERRRREGHRGPGDDDDRISILLDKVSRLESSLRDAERRRAVAEDAADASLRRREDGDRERSRLAAALRDAERARLAAEGRADLAASRAAALERRGLEAALGRAEGERAAVERQVERLEGTIALLVEEGRGVAERLVDAEEAVKEQGELVEALQNENGKQRQQKMETMAEAGCVLRETNTLLETKEEAALTSLSSEREAFVRENAAITEESMQSWNMIQLKLQAALSAKVVELENENKQQEMQIKTLTEAKEKLQAGLSAKVEELRAANNKHTQRIESLVGAEGILREMNEVLGREKETMRLELGQQIIHLRRKNAALADEMAVLKEEHMKEKERMQSEEGDLTWKINALTQNTSLRLKEKDVAISRLGKHIRGQLKETAMLKSEINRRDAEKRLPNRNARLPELQAMVKHQQAELEQRDIVISELREEIEDRYKSEILGMQSKVDQIWTWLHESLSSTTPPCSPGTRSPNQHSSLFECSNPQSSLKSPPKNPQKILMEDVVL